ncbi:hypothetical protein B0T25DRAFT_157606 [Lasiosphaeria hispida]|uniref:Uncharacterized protein n=1 Tax=Lasiosphaeria hispida TaxID=260671 RepID=A0AAJ0HMQ8_9PEZI|nr:hypothetical protein B0T25DRAFT_157606 [Lasiosphaeria hispida]
MTSILLLLLSPASLFRLFALLLAVGAGLAQAQDATEASTTTADATAEPTSEVSSSSPTATGITRVVQIFFIDERSYEGLPYTMLHKDSGAVIGVEADRTTFVITSTRVDNRPLPLHSRTDNVTTGIPTLTSARLGHITNATGLASTITQGPGTFEYTGTRYGPDHTLINRCSLNGTASAVCNLTHVGPVWYTKDPAWNGTFSTYSYNWTSGDRFGFAPVTITAGAEMLAETSPTASGTPNGAARRALGGGEAGTAVVVVGAVLAVGVGFLL